LGFPVQQTASLSGAGTIIRHRFSEKTPAAANFTTGSQRHAYCIPSHKMNCNQVIRPEIEPTNNGGHGGQPGLAKIRRRLGLTFVLSNPFRVPVAQPRAAPEADAAKKVKRESI
jgi:hypothetical protein